MLTRFVFIFLFFSISQAQAETSLLGWNWAKLRGLRMAQDLIKNETKKSPLGVEISPEFWTQLWKAQADAENMAGDGLYFSTHLFNSAHFGPNLLIVELVLKSGEMNDFVTSLTAKEAADQLPEKLSPVVRYSGTWHVIKRLPTKDEAKSFRIFIRPPTAKDADRIFRQFGLAKDIVKVSEYLMMVTRRGMKDDHETTQDFLNRFKEQLIEQVPITGLSLGHLLSPEAARLNENIRQLIELLDYRKQGPALFKMDLKSHLYKTLLNSEGSIADEILASLFCKDPETLIQLSQGKVLERVLRRLPEMKGVEAFLIAREHILNYGVQYLTPDELSVARNLDLPVKKMFYVGDFYSKKFKALPTQVQRNYFERLRKESKSKQDLDLFDDYVKAFKFDSEADILAKSCKSFF